MVSGQRGSLPEHRHYKSLIYMCHSGKLDPRSPINVAFRTVTFMNRSPITLHFDNDQAYEPSDEDVFDENEDEATESSTSASTVFLCLVL